jgi:hypothetical protein
MASLYTVMCVPKCKKPADFSTGCSVLDVALLLDARAHRTGPVEEAAASAGDDDGVAHEGSLRDAMPRRQ